MKKSALSLAVVAMLGAGAAGAQQVVENEVARKTDWSVFEAQSPHECWIVAVPKETVNTRDGRLVAVRRGQFPPQLMVYYRPEEGKAPQVAFFAGEYKGKADAPAGLKVDDTEFPLVAINHVKGKETQLWAWPRPEDESRVIEKMKLGKTAIVTTQSWRGTRSEDKFSLMGFSAALEEAARRCLK